MGFEDFSDWLNDLIEKSGESVEKVRDAMRGCKEEEIIVEKPDC